MARRAVPTRRRKGRQRRPSVLVTAVAVAATAALLFLAVQWWPRRGGEGEGGLESRARTLAPAEHFSAEERQALEALLRGKEPNARPR